MALVPRQVPWLLQSSWLHMVALAGVLGEVLVVTLTVSLSDSSSTCLAYNNIVKKLKCKSYTHLSYQIDIRHNSGRDHQNQRSQEKSLPYNHFILTIF